MTDYTKLVQALRCKRDDCEGCDLAFLDNDEGWMCQYAAKDDDAADAIEELQQKWFTSERDATNLTGRLAQAEADIERLNLEIDKRIATEIELSNHVDALQAEVKRLKEANDEPREAQTYIDHYGDRWMTSAKDVPTSAYEHGYMDGRDEAMAKMEVQE